MAIPRQNFKVKFQQVLLYNEDNKIRFTGEIKKNVYILDNKFNQWKNIYWANQ